MTNKHNLRELMEYYKIQYLKEYKKTRHLYVDIDHFIEYKLYRLNKGYNDEIN